MAENENKSRVFLSITQKMNIAEELEKGLSVKTLSGRYGVSRDVIYRIRRDYHKLSNFAIRGGRVLKHKNRRTSSNEDLENKLYTWFLEQRAMGNPINDFLLQEKGNQLLNEVASTSFAGSRGWIQKFKKRYGIKLAWAHGEQGSADAESAEEFITSFVNRLEEEDIDANRIYNMDETGLLWKTLPSKSLISNEEGPLTGKKIRKDRISIGLCANGNGTHKLPLIFINKYKNPRALRNCNELPVIYRSQKQAWMTGDIFREWYEKCFKTSVRQYHLEQGISGKVILCVDNCSSHRGIQNEDNFELMYLPPNTTSLIQPMDQGVIAKFKVLYRHKILRRILQYEKGVTDFYRLFNIKECINFVEEAWTNITANNIRNSWNKILGRDGREGGIEEDENARELDVSVHSALSDVIHTISGESTTHEECQEMLEALTNDENVNEQNMDEVLTQEEEEEEEEQEEAEKVNEHEEQNRMEEIEDGVAESEKQNEIEENKKELAAFENTIKKFAKGNPTLLALGVVLKHGLEMEALPKKKDNN
nr:PREDICTED: jerky protein homolog-like [Megachile rotundata]